MFFALIVTLYTSRVVLNTLGVMDYGVYNTIAGFVTMFAFLNSTLSASVQRFYNYEGVKNNEEGYRNVYSVAIIVHFVVILAILLILETIGVWYVNNMMVIPGDRLPSANVIFQTSIVSLCLLVLSIPYSGAVLAAEKMDFYAIVSILDTFLKLLCVLSLPYLPSMLAKEIFKDASVHCWTDNGSIVYCASGYLAVYSNGKEKQNITLKNGENLEYKTNEYEVAVFDIESKERVL